LVGAAFATGATGESEVPADDRLFAPWSRDLHSQQAVSSL